MFQQRKYRKLKQITNAVKGGPVFYCGLFQDYQLTQLVKKYLSIDGRVKKLCLSFKYWAKVLFFCFFIYQNRNNLQPSVITGITVFQSSHVCSESFRKLLKKDQREIFLCQKLFRPKFSKLLLLTLYMVKGFWTLI